MDGYLKGGKLFQSFPNKILSTQTINHLLFITFIFFSLYQGVLEVIKIVYTNSFAPIRFLKIF